MKDFILDNPLEFAILVIALVGGVVAFFATLCSTKDVSKAVKAFKEVSMLYRTPSYREEEKKDGVSTGQTFSPIIDEYRYDPDSKEIELTGNKINIDEKIQSYLETRLESILDKFLHPDPVQERNNVVATPSEMEQDLDGLLNAYDEYLTNANILRSKYHLSDDLATDEVYKAVEDIYQDYSAGLNKRIESEVSNESKKKSE